MPAPPPPPPPPLIPVAPEAPAARPWLSVRFSRVSWPARRTSNSRRLPADEARPIVRPPPGPMIVTGTSTGSAVGPKKLASAVDRLMVWPASDDANWIVSGPEPVPRVTWACCCGVS